jgi:N-acetylglucosaminyldiphosphoundecaprenol N-acetyl-beta-D-mannosaminyltransferase
VLQADEPAALRAAELTATSLTKPKFVSVATGMRGFGAPSATLRSWAARDTTQVSISGVHVDSIGFEAAVNMIVDRALRNDPGGYVVTPNAHHVVLHQRDALLRHIYSQAFLVVTDGVPLLWAARLLGRKLPGRVNGTDLLMALSEVAAQFGLRVFFLGGRPGAADAAATTLQRKFPGLEVCGTYCPPLGFETDPAQQADIAQRIEASRPHLLFVGLGAPKQEYWMYANRLTTKVPVSLGIGVSFELIGGMVPRAPRWMQRSGLEWLFRLFSEPKRLWKRYLLGNWVFCALIGRQLVAKLLSSGKAS